MDDKELVGRFELDAHRMETCRLIKEVEKLNSDTRALRKEVFAVRQQNKRLIERCELLSQEVDDCIREKWKIQAQYDDTQAENQRLTLTNERLKTELNGAIECLSERAKIGLF
jgi:regulator of replication initiation timing